MTEDGTSEIVQAIGDLRDGQRELNESVNRLVDLELGQLQGKAVSDENTEALLEDMRDLLRQIVETGDTTP